MARQQLIPILVDRDILLNIIPGIYHVLLKYLTHVTKQQNKNIQIIKTLHLNKEGQECTKITSPLDTSTPHGWEYFTKVYSQK